MGDSWWRRKEKKISRYHRTLDRSREKKRMSEEKRLLGERREKIVESIGFVAYYSRRKARSDAEKEHPRPIVSLEDETG
eukprot:CAMPEP_0181130500 /NCGR_PEP_ID=MMETSP1071-20121207/29904_1 /TAXON_ID=35127 /ORGANISM="Thalassiosira sp., Strain NH16" /LENGTH=78 /DNA_ID=CAMNT_0023216589 /DNA_START=72 /DNA_END=305 /DNA_ORIENTATION=+